MPSPPPLPQPSPPPPPAAGRPSSSSSSTSTSSLTTAGLFADPAGYYPPTPPPTTQTYTQPSTGRTLTLRLVGQSALEAHTLWNGARVAADHLDAQPALVRGRAVLELGAGAGLPSLVAGLLGARAVVVSDYPDLDLVANLQANVDACQAWFPPRGRRAVGREGLGGARGEEEGDGRGQGDKGVDDTINDDDGDDDDDGAETVMPAGFIWGGDVGPLLALLPAGAAGGGGGGFDVLILADLLFRHSEHGRLVKTVRETLARRRASVALVVFSSYRPWLRDKDLAFFGVARAAGLETEKLFDRILPRPLFEDDPGDEEVRKTVSAWAVRWPAHECEDE